MLMPDHPRHRIRRRPGLAPRPAAPAHSSGGDAAFDDLRYIRRTMEKAASFTVVPGWGMVMIGSTAVAAAIIIERLRIPTGSAPWLVAWLADAALALVIAFWSMQQKSRRTGMPLYSAPARR